MLRAAILDDEVRGSALLVHKLQQYADMICVEAVYNSSEIALDEIRELKIDVLFLDIEMPYLNGFQFLEQLGHFEFEIIFVTAYNGYTLEALRAQALDYLLKPVDPNELAAAILKLTQKIERQKFLMNKGVVKEGSVSQRIVLPTSEGVHLVKKDEIIRINAMSNYSVFHLSHPSKIIVSKTLKEFECTLVENNFVRVNRSTIVNLEYVVKYKKGDGGTLIMSDDAEIEISPNKKSLVLAKLFIS